MMCKGMEYSYCISAMFFVNNLAMVGEFSSSLMRHLMVYFFSSRESPLCLVILDKRVWYMAVSLIKNKCKMLVSCKARMRVYSSAVLMILARTLAISSRLCMAVRWWKWWRKIVTIRCLRVKALLFCIISSILMMRALIKSSLFRLPSKISTSSRASTIYAALPLLNFLSI